VLKPPKPDRAGLWKEDFVPNAPFLLDISETAVRFRRLKMRRWRVMRLEDKATKERCTVWHTRRTAFGVAVGFWVDSSAGIEIKGPSFMDKRARFTCL